VLVTSLGIEYKLIQFTLLYYSSVTFQQMFHNGTQHNKYGFVTVPPVGGQVLQSACLYLSVCPLIYCKNLVQISSNFLYWYNMLLVAIAWSSFWCQCNKLCISGSIIDVKVSHNGANGPESNMTRMFCLVRQVAAPGTKSAVFDCILLQSAELPTSTCNSAWIIFNIIHAVR